MALSPLEQAAALLTAMGAGGLVGKFADLLIARGKAKSHEPADLIRSLSELSGTLSDGGQQLANGFIEEFKFLRGEIGDVRKVAGELRAKVEECEGRHADCEAKHAELAARFDASERHRAELLATTDRLMNEHPPATYGPRELSGAVPPKT